jgi:hypothetical protein
VTVLVMRDASKASAGADYEVNTTRFVTISGLARRLAAAINGIIVCMLPFRLVARHVARQGQRGNQALTGLLN